MTDTAASTRPSARRANKRTIMRQDILVTARQIVEEQGVDALSLRSIARAMGYSASALYEYYESKEEILEALYFMGTGGLALQMLETYENLPSGTSTIDALMALGMTYRDYAHANPDLYWLAFSRLQYRPEHGPVMDDALSQTSVGPFLRVIQEGVANGTLSDVIPPGAMAISGWSAVHGFVSLELSGHLTFDILAWRTDPLVERKVQRRDDLFAVLLRTTIGSFVRRPAAS